MLRDPTSGSQPRGVRRGSDHTEELPHKGSRVNAGFCQTRALRSSGELHNMSGQIGTEWDRRPDIRDIPLFAETAARWTDICERETSIFSASVIGRNI